jgi:hypothetical protein
MLALILMGLTDSSSISLSLYVSLSLSLSPVLFAESKLEISIGIARVWLIGVAPFRNNPIRSKIRSKG